MPNPIKVVTIMDAEAILASANSDSNVVDLDAFRPEQDRFGLQATIGGTGTAKIQVYVSADNSVWVEQGDGDVVAGLGAGNAYYELTPELCRYLKVNVLEDGGANAITATLTFVVQ